MPPNRSETGQAAKADRGTPRGPCQGRGGHGLELSRDIKQLTLAHAPVHDESSHRPEMRRREREWGTRRTGGDRPRAAPRHLWSL